MGQTNSRPQIQSAQHAAANSATASPAPGASTELLPSSPVDAGADTSNPQQSRRSSVRKNILKLVTPSNIRNRLNSFASTPGDLRRPWRNSRRWSKAEHDSVPQHEESHPGSSSGSSSSTAGPSTISPYPLDKGKQKEISSPTEEDEVQRNAMTTPCDETQIVYPISSLESESTHMPMDLLSITPPVVDPSVHSFDVTHELTPPGHPTNSSSHEIHPVSFELPTPPLLEQHQATAEQIQAQRPASLARQFPPPGTLVVVQGIVHTTDVTRPTRTISSSSENLPLPQLGSESNVGPDQYPRRTRNRLSALLRPRSSSRPVSTTINETPFTTETTVFEGDSPYLLGPDSLDSPVSSADSAHTAITTPNINDSGDISEEPLPASDQVPPQGENQSTAISSSSIDVLGTLLSVAAAATAASLLTGSSEPILSSGLAPPLPGSPPYIPNHTHNASMPTLPSYMGPTLPTATLPDVSATGRSERMRQAWGTIRERLGLRPSTSPVDDVNNEQDDDDLDSAYSSPNADGIGLNSPTDTRELMLAEMARAFNIGLGLNGLGGLAPGSSPINGVTDREATGGNTILEGAHLPEVAENPLHRPAVPEASGTILPPEGSFERFLVDLQIDLRTALTQPANEPDTQGPPSSAQAHPHPEHSSLSSPNEAVPVPSSSTPVPWVSPGTSHNSGAIPANNRTPRNSSTVPSDISDSLYYRDQEYVDTNFSRDITDSDSEFDEEHGDDEYEDDDYQSAEQSSHHAQHTHTQQGHNSGTGRIDASGRINWWRLYRFPPIVSPHHELPGPRMPSSSASTSPINAGSSEPSSVGPTESIPLPFSTNNTLPPQPNAQSVVPVIVVGLQSVNSDWRPDLPPQGDEEGVDFFAQPNPDMINDDDDDLDGWGNQHNTGLGGHGMDGPSRLGRGRGWQSRAANAIRNLRPGRRNVEALPDAETAGIPPGSRTFLIYVIGGYYPPDHNIVTGGPNILDSFEALLELADLLGQVKPPTVSKDDIAKSGLEIIKASELPQYEEEGKVSSNCLDRCLICLDDYEPEDPIRVMSCRHAFHRNCVDEWLQKGRNNCPACRSTGVPTDSHSTAPLPNPAS